MNHTPVPWSVNVWDNSSGWHPGHHVDVIAPGQEATICECDTDGGDEEAEANGAFIVRACNAHDELVGALEDILEDLQEADAVVSLGVLERALAAIAKATGKGGA